MTSTQFRHVSQDLVPCGPCQKRTVRIQSAPPSTMRKSVLWELVGWRHKKSENSGRTFEHAYVSLCSCYVGVIGTSRRPGCGNPVRWRGLSSRALEPLSHVSHAKRTRCNLLCNIAYKENYWTNFSSDVGKKSQRLNAQRPGRHISPLFSTVFVRSNLKDHACHAIPSIPVMCTQPAASCYGRGGRGEQHPERGGQ